jgi:CRP-like cAMP-binding protein
MPVDAMRELLNTGRCNGSCSIAFPSILRGRVRRGWGTPPAGRYATSGYSSTEFVLRMTRAEIALYLGLSVETVSRPFSRLRKEGFIQVQGRSVRPLAPMACADL